MIPPQPLFVKFLDIVNMLIPDIEVAPKRGRPYTYSPKVMLKCYVIMVVKRCFSHRALHAFLSGTDSYILAIRKAIGLENIPNRRTFDRRFKRFSEVLIWCIGKTAKTFFQEGLVEIKTVAIDSTLFAAKGGIWHQMDLKKGVVPCGNIDTDARWGKSKTKGWIFGYGVHAVSSTGEVVIPLSADVVSANTRDNRMFEKVASSLPPETKFIAADKGYDDKNLKMVSGENGKRLITPIKVCRNTGKERRREAEFFNSEEGQAIYQKRSVTIEPLFGQIKEVFSLEGKLPMKRLERVRSLVLTCIFTFQCAVYFNVKNNLPAMRVKHLIWAM